MAEPTLITKFRVVGDDGGDTFDTNVFHHTSDSGYELFSIVQWFEDVQECTTVLLHREQLAALASIAKGH